MSISCGVSSFSEGTALLLLRECRARKARVWALHTAGENDIQKVRRFPSERLPCRF